MVTSISTRLLRPLAAALAGAMMLSLAWLFDVGLLPAAGSATETYPGDNGKIVFVRRGDLWVMSKRGRNETRLTNTKARETHPTVSPDGQRIAFTRTRGAFREAIFTMRMNGRHLKRLTGFRDANAGPRFSPDGKKILYTWSSGEDIAQVRIMNRNGANKKRLTGTRDNFSPVWSRSGKRVAYFNRLGRRPGLYVMNANGSGKERILDDPLGSVDGWGPARRILFTTADGHIATIKPDGSRRRLLTSAGRLDHSPSYSPDGTRIGWQRCRRSDCRFFVMRPGGSTRRLSGTTRPSGGPTWSPSGDRLVAPFFTATRKRWDLRLLMLEGSSAWLTNRGGIRESAAWQSR